MCCVELRQYSSLHEELFLTEWNLGHFSEVVYMGYDTIFLDQNLMGNPKKESKIQNNQPLRRFWVPWKFPYTYSGNSVRIDPKITHGILICNIVVSKSK